MPRTAWFFPGSSCRTWSSTAHRAKTPTSGCRATPWPRGNRKRVSRTASLLTRTSESFATTERWPTHSICNASCRPWTRFFSASSAPSAPPRASQPGVIPKSRRFSVGRGISLRVRRSPSGRLKRDPSGINAFGMTILIGLSIGRSSAESGAGAELFVVAEVVNVVPLQLHEHDASAEVYFGVRRQPDLAVDFFLLEHEVRAFRERGDQPAADFHRFGEMSFEPHDFARLFVHPHGSGKFLDDAVHALFRLVVRVPVHVEGDHFLAAEKFAARIREKLGAQEIGELRFVFLLLLRLFLGIGGELGLLLLKLVEFLVELVVLGFLFVT